jgi:hypothetical protein
MKKFLIKMINIFNKLILNSKKNYKIILKIDIFKYINIYIKSLNIYSFFFFSIF